VLDIVTRGLCGLTVVLSLPSVAILALHVTTANEQDRAHVAELVQQVQQMTGEAVEVAFVDQGYTGAQAAADAEAEGIRLEVVRLPEAKKGFVMLPRR